MAKSTVLKLNLTPEIEIAQTLFDDWRQSIDGYQGTNPSNFEIIDEAIGEINEKLETLTDLQFKKVDQLPRKDQAETNIIYLVASSESGELNIYYEYIFLEEENEYELIGSTQITFDNVPTKDSPNAITSGGVYNALLDKQNVIQDLDTIRSGAQKGETAVQPDDLATVATTGSYNDLIDKPEIPLEQIQSDWEQEDTTAKDYIKNKPDIEDMIAEEQSRAIAVETELDTKIEGKQDKLTAGANITIDSNNVISATGGGGSPIEAGTGIKITTESDDTKTISIDDTVVATKNDIPTNYVTTNTSQNISGLKVFINGSGIQSRSSFRSDNRAILNGYSDTPYLELQRGSGHTDNLTIRPNQISYLPYNGSQNTDFNIITHYPGMNNKAFTYTFKAPLYTDTAKTLTVATTDDITAISGTNDGTNWTSLTIGEDTYSLASGGGSGMDITAQEIEDYFDEYCDIEAEVTEETIEGENVNVLTLENVDLENETEYLGLDLNASNVSAANKILDIE